MKTGYCLALSYLCVVAGIVFPKAGFAQDPFIITGSDPANGATSVPTGSLVTFTFSDPLDATARYSSGLPVGILDPSGTIIPRIVGYSVSPDQLSITLAISNPEDADLALVITGAKRQDGEPLCVPFAFNYSTKSSQGTAIVSGTISRYFLVKQGGGCEPSPFAIIAALYDGPINQGGSSLYATVSDLTSYEITNVRSGIYWPYFFYDLDGNGEIDEIHYPEVYPYDSNGDGVIDLISTESGDVSGIHTTILVSLAVEDESLPSYFALGNVYPNPFRSSATITYSLPNPSEIRIEVFDLLGKRVRMLEKGFKSSGEHEITFDATGLPSGVYFYTLSAGDFSQTRKMVVLR